METNSAPRGDSPSTKKRFGAWAVPLAFLLIGWLLGSTFGSRGTTGSLPQTSRTSMVLELPDASQRSPSVVGRMTMADVIKRARGVQKSMQESLNDYTATFVKIQREDDGKLGEPTTMEMKVQTKMRSAADDAPMRVFLRYLAPPSKAGRKVIWGEDLYDGKLAVHEVGMLLSLKTIWLDPQGAIAMRGQKYPINEIGLAKLVEKLIERGEDDLESPDIEVSQQTDFEFEGKAMERILVRRSRPTGDEDDFATAEIVLDPERNLILQYRSYGWPEAMKESSASDSENVTQELPLIESYTYQNLQTNVGLTEKDFDVKNPEYDYPVF